MRDLIFPLAGGSHSPLIIFSCSFFCNSWRRLDVLVNSISIYIPSLPEGADKDAIRNVFAGLVEAQRYDTSLSHWDNSVVRYIEESRSDFVIVCINSCIYM